MHLIWCDLFSPYKLNMFFSYFFCLWCSLSLIFTALAWPYSPFHLLHTQCLQQDKCRPLVSAHYFIADPIQFHLLNYFLVQIQCLILLHSFGLLPIVHIFYRSSVFIYFYIMPSLITEIHFFLIIYSLIR